MIQIIQNDLSDKEKEYIFEHKYVSVDTETTGLNYIEDDLCTIQIMCDELAIIIKFDSSQSYNNLKQVLYSEEITKIFHNAVFDVSFLMKNLNMDEFGSLVCTKIASKLINGLKHNNSLKPLLQEYLNIKIDKSEQLSDWAKENLSESQKDYAINDVKYLGQLWRKMHAQLKEAGLEETADKCFEFVPYYKKTSDKGIENIFAY